MNNEENTTQSVREAIKDVMTEVEKSNHVKTIFGESIREKDVVIIPVATIAMKGGGGGGGGQGDAGAEEGKFPKWGKGSGLGLGYARKVQPLGYIEIKDSKVTFKPIVDATKIAMVFIGASVLGMTMLLKSFGRKK